MAKEAKARIKINKLLEEAGWRFFDDENGKANIQLESNVKITENQLDEFGEDFEKTKHGYIDFLLLDEEGFPAVVLEAKREEKKPLDAKEQARAYARGVHARFVILSNGNLHYFWDTETGNPEVITKFPSQKSVGHKRQFKPNSANLVREVIDNDYVLLTQRPDYSSDPRWLDESQRVDFLRDNGLMLLREYQKRAVHSIQRTVNEGNSRFLFEMATGTGKTLIAAAVIKLFLRTSNAKRVLFLVDRIELENQAWRAFSRYLKNDYDTVIYKQHRDDWQRAEIVVTTIQSLLSDNKYKSLFSPTDFDLLISDEAHRSIGGNSRAVFEYFIGYKLGLTSTPKDYLKNIANINERDPREIERRILLDTYETFGCESGVPTFRYSLVDGVKEKFLVSPTVVDARTEITTQLLSDQGYSVIVTDQDGEDKEAIFTQRDFERKFLSEETNKAFCKVFMENALRDPLSSEIGKTIMFCVSQDHASKITQYLNEMAHNLWPGKYNSDFAVQVTSAIIGSQQFSINFANNNLNGHTRWLDTYKSSRTRVCVTVGMMTTGYDCEDIKNLCFMRPVFSPSDFVQMKGRGTRRFTFKYTSKDGAGKTEVFTKEKKSFKLFDFFGNCDYFEEQFNYDEVIELPPTGGVTDVEGPLPVHIPDYENVSPDPLKTLEQTPIGVDGMRVDRELFGRFEYAVKEDEFVRQNVEAGDFEGAEAYILQHIFDKPEEFFNLEKLRKSVQLDRRLTLREILEKIFGMIPGFKSKEQLLDEECDKFISIYKPDSDYVLPVRNFLKAYVTEEQVRDIMRTKEYAKFFTMPVGEDFIELPPQMRETIPEYVKDYIPLNKYM
ncbi:MAG: restriction endonuclease subunit R [Planctomycetes bacterium RBG_13_46_10]|nr:MAG: restriction endonuclease subunit R [Planctomycetes bacterium RBG_13_46_10]